MAIAVHSGTDGTVKTKVAPGTHGAALRVLQVLLTECGMALSEAFRDQEFNTLTK